MTNFELYLLVVIAILLLIGIAFFFWLNARHKKELKKAGDAVLTATSMHRKSEVALKAEQGRTAELEKQALDLQHQAYHDEDTGLPKKGRLHAAIDDVLRTDKARRPQTCLIYIDGDRFKPINDTCGHLAADYVIVHLATIIKSTVRPLELVCRFGGDEFAVLAMNATEQEGLKLAERIRQRIAAHDFIWKGKTLKVTASLGVASLRNGESVDGVCARADRFLYDAKGEHRKGNAVAPSNLHGSLTAVDGGK